MIVQTMQWVVQPEPAEMLAPVELPEPVIVGLQAEVQEAMAAEQRAAARQPRVTPIARPVPQAYD